MIGLIVNLQIVAGREAEFETAFKKQAKGVHADEPGNKLYEIFRSRKEPNKYVALEIYTDEEAIKAHRNAPHMVANRETMAALIDGKPTFELFDPVVVD